MHGGFILCGFATLTITHGLFNVLSIALGNDVLSLVDWHVSHFEGIYKY